MARAEQKKVLRQAETENLRAYFLPTSQRKNNADTFNKVLWLLLQGIPYVSLLRSLFQSFLHRLSSLPTMNCRYCASSIFQIASRCNVRHPNSSYSND